MFTSKKYLIKDNDELHRIRDRLIEENNELKSKCDKLTKENEKMKKTLKEIEEVVNSVTQNRWKATSAILNFNSTERKKLCE